MTPTGGSMPPETPAPRVAEGEPIVIYNTPCTCAPNECAAIVDPPSECINRLADAVTAPCDKCSATTWHSGGNCLRCQRSHP
jgi:hypothetical protein